VGLKKFRKEKVSVFYKLLFLFKEIHKICIKLLLYPLRAKAEKVPQSMLVACKTLKPLPPLSKKKLLQQLSYSRYTYSSFTPPRNFLRLCKNSAFATV